ncbi:MAG: O-antigen ligase family protein [Opitutales bacterium]|nr:O-antigen ligase family protein [Opitutales bacterium]
MQQSTKFIPIYAALILAPFIVIPGLWEYANLPKLVIIQTCVGVTFSLALAEQAFRKKLVQKATDPLLFFPFLIVTWAGLSLLWSIDSFRAYHTWLQWIGAFCVYAFILVGGHANTIANRLLHIFPITGLLVSLLGVIQHYLEFSLLEQSVAPAATFFNKNVAAHFLLLSIPFTMGAICKFKSLVRVVLYLSLFSQILYFFIVRSEASIIALCISVIVCSLIFSLKFALQKSHLYLALLAICLAAIAFPLSQLNPSYTQANLTNDLHAHWQAVTQLESTKETSEIESSGIDRTPTGSIPLRLSLWRNTFQIIKDHPLIGTGLGSWNEYYPKAVAKTKDQRAIALTVLPNTAHNDYLQYAAETGLVGILLILGFAAFILKKQFQSKFHTFRSPATISLLAVLINMMLSNFWGLALDTFHIAILTAIVVSSPQNSDSSRHARVSSSRSLLVVLLSGFCLYFIYHERLKSDRFGKSIQSALFSRNSEQAIALSEFAGLNAGNPFDNRALPLYAQALYNAGDYESSLKAFDVFLTRHPYHPLFNFQAGVTARKLQKWERAEFHFEQAINVIPNDPEILYQSGLLLIDKGEIEAALLWFEQMTEKDFKTLHSWFWITQLSFALNQLETTAKALIEINNIHPQFPPMIHWLRSQMQANETRQKMERLREILKTETETS